MNQFISAAAPSLLPPPPRWRLSVAGISQSAGWGPFPLKLSCTAAISRGILLFFQQPEQRQHLLAGERGLLRLVVDSQQEYRFVHHLHVGDDAGTAPLAHAFAGNGHANFVAAMADGCAQVRVREQLLHQSVNVVR